MEFLGIRVYVAINLFKSFLSERTQIVKVNDYYSKAICIYCGVPQGLRPSISYLFYKWYFIQYKYINCNMELLSFADDTAV